MNRRALVQSGISAAAMPLLTRCAGRAERRDPGYLRIGAGPDRYNSARGRFSFTLSRPNIHIAEPPLHANRSMEPVPWLFERWHHQGNGSYLGHLRKGVAFHNGAPLNADSFIAGAKEFIASRDFIGLDPRSLRRVDERVVSFASLTGSALMADTMTHPSASLLYAGGDVKAHPIGTGPYRFVRYEPKRLIEVERFESYWGAKPYNTRISYRFIADPQARLLALRSGGVDLISDVVPEMLAGLAPDDPAVTLHHSRPARYAALFCNLRGSPPFHTLRDVRVRRALAWSIDRDAIAKVMYQGRAEVAKGVLPGWMYGLGGDTPQGFGKDLARAASLLEEAGWKMGEDGIRTKDRLPLKLRLVSGFPNASAVKPMPELLERMFRSAGVQLEIAEVEDSELYYSAYADRGLGDLFLELAGGGNSDPTWLLSNLFHSKGPWVAYHHQAPGLEIDSLIDAARRDSDRQRVVDRIREAQRKIVDGYVAAIPILMVPVFVLTKPGMVLEMAENLDWINFGFARFGA
jgi:peptide/nickel transport system substrate-binding protein